MSCISLDLTVRRLQASDLDRTCMAPGGTGSGGLGRLHGATPQVRFIPLNTVYFGETVVTWTTSTDSGCRQLTVQLLREGKATMASNTAGQESRLHTRAPAGARECAGANIGIAATVVHATALTMPVTHHR